MRIGSLPSLIQYYISKPQLPVKQQITADAPSLKDRVITNYPLIGLGEKTAKTSATSSNHIIQIDAGEKYSDPELEGRLRQKRIKSIVIGILWGITFCTGPITIVAGLSTRDVSLIERGMVYTGCVYVPTAILLCCIGIEEGLLYISRT